eukprot:scaffold21556_cov120-Isochrysis_galbana.AAC.6
MCAALPSPERRRVLLADAVLSRDVLPWPASVCVRALYIKTKTKNINVNCQLRADPAARAINKRYIYILHIHANTKHNVSAKGVLPRAASPPPPPPPPPPPTPSAARARPCAGLSPWQADRVPHAPLPPVPPAPGVPAARADLRPRRAGSPSRPPPARTAPLSRLVSHQVPRLLFEQELCGRLCVVKQPVDLLDVLLADGLASRCVDKHLCGREQLDGVAERRPDSNLA